MARAPEHWDVETDMVVVGSGGGGLTCAITARDRGAQVTMLECTDKVGGTTSYSGGELWIPNNHHMRELGLPDSFDEGVNYIRGVSGGWHNEEMLQAFLLTAPEMLKYIEEKTGLEMLCIGHKPDYYAEHTGGKMGARYMTPNLFDSKKLGDWQPRLRTSPHFPMAASFHEMEAWGGFTNITSWDWALIGKRMQEGIVGFGAGLTGPLLKRCLEQGVNIMLQTRARKLLQDSNGRVIGVKAEQKGQNINVKGRLGVLLACGGYEWNEGLMRLMGSPPGTRAYSVPSNRGDGHIMGMEIGAAFQVLEDAAGPCLSVPGEQHDGQPLYRVFVLEPARPHMIVVNRQGKRFANEALWRVLDGEVGRFDHVTQSYSNMPCFALFDQKYKDRYSFASSMPGEEAPDWMNGSTSLRELASKLEINPDNLEETVATFNKYAKEGKDPHFHRGEQAYDRYYGDKSRKPNPSLGPIEKPPFYGVKLVRGCAGPLSGLLTNNKAQVINIHGEVIRGLYATTNVAARTVFGFGVSGGQSIAQGMTFGYIVGRHATEGLVKSK